MRHRVAWLSTAPLMLAGLLAGHSVGYRLAYSDPHARADALGHSGHSYFSYLPFALAICVGVLLAGLALHAISAFRGEPRRPAASPVIVLLPPVAFVAQEVTERLVHTGQIPWTHRPPTGLSDRPRAAAALRARRAASRVGARLRGPRCRRRARLDATPDVRGRGSRTGSRHSPTARRRPGARVRRARAASSSPAVTSSEGAW